MIFPSWCLWGFPLSPCLPFSHFQDIVVNPPPSSIHKVPAHGFIKLHIHGRHLWIYCGSNIVFMLAQSYPWRSVGSSGQPSYLTNIHRLFPFPQFWWSKSMKYRPRLPPRLGYLKLHINQHIPQFYQISPPLGLDDTIIASFFVHFLQRAWVIFSHGNHTGSGWVLAVFGWKSLLRLALTLKIFFFQRLKEFLIETVFCVHHLLPLVHLGRMLLDPPWYFLCLCIRWHWICLWRTGLECKLFPGDHLVCGLLHFHPD